MSRNTLYRHRQNKEVVRLGVSDLVYVLGLLPADLRRAHVWPLLRQLGPLVGVLVPDAFNS